jgi:plasmid stabilization system protein ParE
LLLRAEAAADVEAAYVWYEKQRPGLGAEFLDAVQSTLGMIREHPAAAPVVHEDIRRSLLKRFPYGVYYRQIAGDIVVIACFHASRNPRVWKERR